MVCWGFNHQGELGLGDTQDRSMPTPVPSFDGLFLTCIAARVSQVLAISCGDLYVWGLPYSYAPAVHVPRRLAGPSKYRKEKRNSRKATDSETETKRVGFVSSRFCSKIILSIFHYANFVAGCPLNPSIKISNENARKRRRWYFSKAAADFLFEKWDLLFEKSRRAALLDTQKRRRRLSPLAWVVTLASPSTLRAVVGRGI